MRNLYLAIIFVFAAYAFVAYEQTRVMAQPNDNGMAQDILGFTIHEKRIEVTHSAGIPLERLLCVVSCLKQDKETQIVLTGLEPPVLKALPEGFDTPWIKLLWKADGGIAIYANGYMPVKLGNDFIDAVQVATGVKPSLCIVTRDQRPRL